MQINANNSSRPLFVLLLFLTFVSANYACPSQSSAEVFEFLDDFFKSPSQQRNPWCERIDTERHDFTQSATTVGRHVKQLEFGYSYFYRDHESERESSHTTPELLFRYGLSEDVELRLRWNYAWQFISEESDKIGAEPLRFGIKLQMTRQCCEYSLVPTSALEIRATAPTAGRDFDTGGSDYSLDYIYQWNLTKKVRFAGSTGFITNGLGDFGLLPDEPKQEDYIGLTQSAVLGLERNESSTFYAEWFCIYSQGLEDEFVDSVFNIGIDQYISDDFVLDLRAGIGLTDDADNSFFGVGGGYRF